MADTNLQSLTFPGLSDTYKIRNIPSGGTSGQVLKKASSTDYDVAWANESGGSSITVDSALSSSSTNPVQNSVINTALEGKIAAPSSPATGAFLVYNGTAWDADALTPSDIGAAPAVTEVTVSTAGAVTQALDAGKIYHFTGAVSSLSLTLNAAASGQLAQYHFDFDSGSTAPTLTMPNSVTMPDSFTVEANKRYEVDILNNYGAVMAWAIS